MTTEHHHNDMHLTLHEWMWLNKPGEQKLWRDAAQSQFEFFDRLTSLIASGLPEIACAARDGIARVISTHRSKSLELPVVQWTRPDLGVTFTLRDNFYNFKLSVSSERPIDDPAFPALFHTTPPTDSDYTRDPLASCYFEGFPSVLVYSYQATNKRVWSAEICGQHATYMVVFLCMRALGVIKDLQWARRS